MSSFPKKVKDPEERLDYLFDFTDWMPPGDYISTVTIEAPQGVAIDSPPSNNNTQVQIWAQGGTLDDSYDISAVANTFEGRTAKRSFTLSIKEK